MIIIYFTGFVIKTFVIKPISAVFIFIFDKLIAEFRDYGIRGSFLGDLGDNITPEFKELVTDKYKKRYCERYLKGLVKRYDSKDIGIKTSIENCDYMDLRLPHAYDTFRKGGDDHSFKGLYVIWNLRRSGASGDDVDKFFMKSSTNRETSIKIRKFFHLFTVDGVDRILKEIEDNVYTDNIISLHMPESIKKANGLLSLGYSTRLTHAIHRCGNDVDGYVKDVNGKTIDNREIKCMKRYYKGYIANVINNDMDVETIKSHFKVLSEHYYDIIKMDKSAIPAYVDLISMGMGI